MPGGLTLGFAMHLVVFSFSLFFVFGSVRAKLALPSDFERT